MIEIIREHQLNLMLVLGTMCGVISIYVLATRSTSKRKLALFFCEVIAMLLLFSEREAYLYDGASSAIGYFMVRLSNFCVYFFDVALVFAFNQYLKYVFIDNIKDFKTPKMLEVVDVLCIAAEILVILSQFTGFYYTFDSNNYYVRAQAFPISYIVPLIVFVIQILSVIRYSRYIRKSVSASLFMITVVPFIGAIFQIFYYGVSLINIFLVFAVIHLFIIDLIELNKMSKENQKRMEKLHSQLLSIAETYRTVHDIDLIHDTFTDIVTNSNSINAIIGDNHDYAQMTIYKAMAHIEDLPSKAAMAEFVDFSTLDERLNGKKTIATEFLNPNNVWCKGRFIASERTADGRLSHVLFIVENIDEEKRKREELLNISEKAIAANNAKTDFLRNVSNEIRTPINAILGMNEMILRESQEQNILAYAKSIKASGRTLLGLASDIIDFSKLETGKMEIVEVEYDISSLINDLISLGQIEADNKGLFLDCSFGENIPKILLGDVVRFKQVVATLLSNSVKYTDKGSVKFSIDSEFDSSDPDLVFLHVCIEDTGVGMDAETLGKILYVIENDRASTDDGTAISLSIVASLLKMMGSKLNIESALGLGSRVSFTLKQKVIDREALGNFDAVHNVYAVDQKKYKEKFTAPTANVLIVDDNEINIEVFKAIVKKLCVNVDSAVNGEEGLNLIRKKRYDMIFFDHMMPVMDGVEAVKKLRSEKDNPNVDTPTICVTANSLSGVREEYINEGFNDYVSKPIDSIKLEDLMLKNLPADKIIMSTGVIEAEDKETTGLPEYIRVISRLENQNVLDIEAGIKNSGSEEAYVSLLKIFYDTSDLKIEDIRKCCDDMDMKNYIIRVHAVKSSARIIGAQGLGDRAEKLESAGKENNTLFISNNNEEFLEMYLQIKYILSSALKESSEEEIKPEAGEDIMNDAYNRFMRAADDMDYDQLEKIMKEIDAYRIPIKDQELFSKVRDAIDNFEYDLVFTILNQHANSFRRRKTDE